MNNIQLGNFGILSIMQSSRMEAYIWDDALMDSAMSKAQTCDVTSASSNETLAELYVDNPSRIPIVDSNKTLVGEVLFNATQSLTFIDAMNEALIGWELDCRFLDYFANGCLSNAPSIQNCDNCRRCMFC